MTLRKTELFNELFNKFLEINDNVEAIIVSDEQGLIIAAERRKDIDIEILSFLTSILNPILERIRYEFAFKKFGTANFDTELYRLLFISLDEKKTLSVVLNNYASIDKVSPNAYLLAEKAMQILKAEEGDNIQIIIPNFESETDDSERVKRVKNQIYQMRLEQGGIYRFKFVIIGDQEVGKTSLVKRFVENKFSDSYRATIGFDVSSRSIDLYGNRVEFSIWDIGGQGYFKRLRHVYYQGAQTAFIVFDLTNRNSFDNARKWYFELRNFIQEREIPIIIVGNKSDLKEKRLISYQEAIDLLYELIKQSKIKISYIETSALSGENVENAFTIIAYYYLSQSREEEEERLKKDLLCELNSILEKRKKKLNKKTKSLDPSSLLTLSFISEDEFWSPGLQILLNVNSKIDYVKMVDNSDKKIYKFANGLILKNFIYTNFDVFDSNGVLCIFNARDKEHIDPTWRNIVLKIIDDIEEKKVILIGIKISNKNDWSQIMEEFNVNDLLEKKKISLLFFKLTVEFQLDIYDHLKVMLNSINFS
ncbi:MAG: Rab family GTPase [Promethearchaeota archaeon]